MIILFYMNNTNILIYLIVLFEYIHPFQLSCSLTSYSETLTNKVETSSACVRETGTALDLLFHHKQLESYTNYVNKLIPDIGLARL